MIKKLTIAIASAALLVAPAAHAEAGKGESQTVSVSTTGLDLMTAKGREELERRIELAAKELCGMNDAVTGSRVASRESRKCYRATKAEMTEHFANVTNDVQLGG